MEEQTNKSGKGAKALRQMMIVPVMLLIASVAAEIGNCHSAQLTIRQELNDTITALAECENSLTAKQDTIQRLERINYAMAQPIFLTADQKMPAVLLVLSALSTLTIAYYRREHPIVAQYPASATPHEPTPLQSIRLTPMQRQLVDMLSAAPSRRVPKQDICAALWGNKDNAEESLYTLVRRTKKALAEANAEIVCNRGESYELKFG